MNKQNRNGVQAKQHAMRILNEVLEHRMAFYVLAVGAALGAAPRAEGKVVAHASNAVLTRSSEVLQIDLNNDGVIDFSLFDQCSGNLCSFPRAPGSVSGVQDSYIRVLARSYASGAVGSRLASALKKGAPVASGETFTDAARLAAHNVSDFGYYGASSSSGNFIGVTNRFLGVRFLINGQTHYGWIGFRSVSQYEIGDSFTATLAGWAYETEPNKPIRAGDTGREGIEESEELSALRPTEPTSLELLAAGHAAIADRRRRISA